VTIIEEEIDSPTSPERVGIDEKMRIHFKRSDLSL